MNDSIAYGPDCIINAGAQSYRVPFREGERVVDFVKNNYLGAEKAITVSTTDSKTVILFRYNIDSVERVNPPAQAEANEDLGKSSYRRGIEGIYQALRSTTLTTHDSELLIAVIHGRTRL